MMESLLNVFLGRASDAVISFLGMEDVVEFITAAVGLTRIAVGIGIALSGG